MKNIPNFPDSRLLGASRPPEVPTPSPDWWVSPASVKPLASADDFAVRADSYFRDCDTRDERATITGFCVAIGLPGPTSLLRLGQRVPALRAIISRCCTRIAAGYEAMIGMGQSAGPIFMLKNIPDYDPEEPDGSPGVQFFNDRKEILLQAEVYGAATVGGDFTDDQDPLEVYLSVIKRAGGAGRMGSLTQAARPTAQKRLFAILDAEVIPDE